MPKLALAFDIAANDKGATRTLNRLGDTAERTGKRINHSFGAVSGFGGKLTALAGAGGLGAVIGSSVKLAASFDTTMRQVAAATNTPIVKLKDLSGIALDMGAKTSFSAKEAGDAMLELAKGGLTQAQIKGGALESTLTLAAAGGLALGDAAGYVVQGLSSFGLEARSSAEVAAALAGAANASTASVESIGQALSAVGPGAKLAGLSLQETTGILAAFDKAGLKGSDAGTSLKTMLSRLVPTTDKARAVMDRFGLSFVDSHDNIKDVANIAEQLRKKLGPLNEAERSVALSTIFGSDAFRAAAILMEQGEKGVRAYTKSTSDLTAAQRLAKAATSGTGGALERMRGSVETAQIALGTALAPAVEDVANAVSNFATGPLSKDIIPAIGAFVQGMQDGTGPGGKFADVMGELGDAAGDAWGAARPLFDFIGDHPKLFTEVGKDALILAGALKTIGAVKGLTGGIGGLVGKSTPLPVFVTNPGAFGPGAPGAGGDTTVLPGGTDKDGKGKTGTPKSGGRKLPGLPKALPGAFGALNVAYWTWYLSDLEKQVGDAVTQASRDRQSNAVLDQTAQKSLVLFLEGQMEGALKGLPRTSGSEFVKARGEMEKLLAKAVRVNPKTGGFDVDVDAALEFLRKYGGKTDEVRKKILELETTAQRSGKRTGLVLGDGVGKGVRFAMDRTDALSTDLTRLGEKKALPKIDLNGILPASLKAEDLFGTLTRIDGMNVEADVIVNWLPKGYSAREVTAASGGWITGPGTGTSDSIRTRLSNGEYVVNARAAKRNGPLLEAINSGQTVAPAGNTVVNNYSVVQNYPEPQTRRSVYQELAEIEYLLGS